jgi:predicted transcriptional regulator/transcriptional regulator with XRE-family HTH domain
MNRAGLGAKVRALRKRHGVSQAELAERLKISASYMNLLEAGKRPLTAALLLEIAKTFVVELSAFDDAEEVSLAADLAEVFGDPVLAPHGVSPGMARELATESPPVARATLALYRAYVSARDNAQMLAGRLAGEGGAAGVDNGGLPSEEVSDFVQRHLNHFPSLELAAEELWRDAELDADDLYAGLVRYAQRRFGIQVQTVRVGEERLAMRRYDAAKKTLGISEVLPPRSRRFQLAHQLGLVAHSAELDRILEDARELTTPEAHALARVALASYYAAAVIMPYEPLLEAARAERYDIELLAHRFGASFEQVCHRLTSLSRPGREGVPFHLLRIDMAGNISKRFSASGIRIARFSGACPRWNVHAAFQTPGLIRVQLSRMPEGGVYFCIARTLRSDRGGYHVAHIVQAIGMGCEVRRARELVYSDGVDLENLDAAVPVGTTCRLCMQLDCAQRAFPPLLHPLRIDENVRGVSLYAPVEK